MKNISFFFAMTLFAASCLFAQAPQSFKYQAVVRDANGGILGNTIVSMRISILAGSPAGNSVYTETQQPATNEFGVVSINIGEGNVVSGNFTTIDWGVNTYFVKIELDAAGGSNYEFMGTSQLLSVPYALYAKMSGNSSIDFDTDSTNELQTISKTGNTITLSKGGGSFTDDNFDKDSTNELQTITKTGNIITLSNGGGSVNDSDNQTLSLTGTTLNISNGNSIQIGGTVDLDWDPNNEIQSLSLSNDTLKIIGGNEVILPPNYDNDSTNELQTLSITGNNLTISKGNTVGIPQQTLTIYDDTLTISSGNYILLPPEEDYDTTNEIQNLSLQNDTLAISKGNSIKLSFLEYLVPIGSIIPFAGRTAPAGWLLCNGGTIDRNTYSTLFAVIDSSWGAGNGTTTFNLPDLRGQFLRGVDGIAGIDPDTTLRTAKYSGGNTGNNVGSFQDDDLKSHRHQLDQGFITNQTGGTSLYKPDGGGPNTTDFTQYSGGNETRPKNAYVNFIIKY